MKASDKLKNEDDKHDNKRQTPKSRKPATKPTNRDTGRLVTYLIGSEEDNFMVKIIRENQWVAHLALDRVSWFWLRVCASLGAFSLIGFGSRR